MAEAAGEEQGNDECALCGEDGLTFLDVLPLVRMAVGGCCRVAHDLERERTHEGWRHGRGGGGRGGHREQEAEEATAIAGGERTR
eukprot:1266071-Prymnesium_polylepis.1